MQFEIPSDPLRRPSLVGFAVLITLTACTMFALSRGIVTIDIARDLHRAFQILRGEAFPLIGPPINGRDVLGPVWFYFLAVVLAVTPTLSTAFALVGLFVSLKYWVAYAVGRLWHSERLGISLVLVSALPGVASFQFLGISHPSFVEAALWVAALSASLAYLQPASARWLVLYGLATSIALHAHPTAIIVLMPLSIALLAARATVNGLADVMRSVIWIGGAACVPFSPLLVAYFTGNASFTAGSDLVASTTTPALHEATLNLLYNFFWGQGEVVYETYGAHSTASTFVWRGALAIALACSSVGLIVALLRRSARVRTLLAVAALIVALLAIQTLRASTSFYMAYAAMPLFAICLAFGWVEFANLWRARFVIFVCGTAILAANVFLVYGINRAAREGQLHSRMPFASDLQRRISNHSDTSLVAATARDSYAKWICGQRKVALLHGDTARAIDVGLGHELRMACAKSERDVQQRIRIGGVSNDGEIAWVGLPRAAWPMIGVEPIYPLRGVAFTLPSKVLLPTKPLPPAEGLRYPPRLSTMLANAQSDTWRFEFDAEGSERVVVAQLVQSLGFWEVRALANGNVIAPVVALDGVAVFFCSKCGGGNVRWTLMVRGSMRDTTSITLLSGTLSQ